MSRPIIRVEDLGKEFVIGGPVEPYSTIRESIVRTVRKPYDMILGNGSEKKKFWALKDVSFEVFPGEVLGIIGRNGAGKSTLLKVLSRITEPTKGRVELYGRVGSLLEVGTGFHPELTGRENIYLNGAILGMRRDEITKKFDAIVDFAEIEEFLDTPVKRYSSGMYVRLAFSVAAHLEPEVLIVDEVLAVGDAEFQRKCLAKIKAISRSGKTILIVSHDMRNVVALCSMAILIENGTIKSYGEPSNVIQDYSASNGKLNGGMPKVLTSFLHLESVGVSGDQRELAHDSELEILLEFRSGSTALERVLVDIAIYNEKNIAVIHAKSRFCSSGVDIEPNSEFQVKYHFRNPNLAPGQYTIEVYAYDRYRELLWIENVNCCIVSSRSGFNRDEILEGVFSATVPKFTYEVFP